ncbi:MAG: LysM peptidoglycan-binding domain-containing protein [Hellea sp.]
MSHRLLLLTLGSAIITTACATNQENPYYKYSSQYKNAPVTTVAQAPSVVQTAPVSYETATYEAPSYETVSYEGAQPATYTRVNHECLKSEKNHELLGAGLGGTIGAIAGEKLIGGTKGAVVGAGLGGTAGYGIGDKIVNCDPEPVIAMQSAPVVSQAYISPTDTEFATISGTGTPGYQVLQAQTISAEMPAAAINSQHSPYASSAQEVNYDYEANTVAASTAGTAVLSETRILGATGYNGHIVKDGDTVYSLSRKLCVGVSDIQLLNNLNANYGINIGDQLQLPASRC